jgi:hypothetical protein
MEYNQTKKDNLPPLMFATTYNAFIPKRRKGHFRQNKLPFITAFQNL